jgi:DNA-binding CsgD family transcriptional regulator
MTSGASMTADVRDQLIARAAEAPSIGELFATASARLRKLVPFDASVWLASDPVTGLPTAPTRTENMGHFSLDACLRSWELEFMVEDVNLYSSLAQAERPAAGLRRATGDRPARSPRYRDVLQPKGFGDELRGVLRADDGSWGLFALFRGEGEPAFDEAECELVAGLCGPLGASLREHAQPVTHPFAQGEEFGPGLMLFDPGGELISLNDDALVWLEELAGSRVEREAFDYPLPMVVAGTLMRARAVAEERDRRSARARIRSRATGRWLVCHASCMRDASGELGNTALVIEPAKASEIAPIIAQAYQLTPREQEVTHLIAQGVGTADIADRLYLSPHTVRDHVKTIFEKVGVSSRGELVAKLFAEHYAPIHMAPGGVHRVD